MTATTIEDPWVAAEPESINRNPSEMTAKEMAATTVVSLAIAVAVFQ